MRGPGAGILSRGISAKHARLDALAATRHYALRADRLLVTGLVNGFAIVGGDDLEFCVPESAGTTIATFAISAVEFGGTDIASGSASVAGFTLSGDGRCGTLANNEVTAGDTIYVEIFGADGSRRRARVKGAHPAATVGSAGDQQLEKGNGVQTFDFEGLFTHPNLVLSGWAVSGPTGVTINASGVVSYDTDVLAVQADAAIEVSVEDQFSRPYAVNRSLTVTDVPAQMDAPSLIVESQARIAATRAQAPAENGSSITSYDLRHSDDEATWTTITGISSSTAIQGLTAGTGYFVQTAAVNAVGRGPWSASGTATTLQAIDTQPSWNVTGVEPGVQATLDPGAFPIAATPTIAYALLDDVIDIAEDIEEGWTGTAWAYTPDTAGIVRVAVAWTYPNGTVTSDEITLEVGVVPEITGVSVDGTDPIVYVSTTKPGTAFVVWNQSAALLGSATIISTGQSATIDSDNDRVVTDGAAFDGTYYAHVVLRDSGGLVSDEYVSAGLAFVQAPVGSAPTFKGSGSKINDSLGGTDAPVPLPVHAADDLAFVALSVAGNSAIATDYSGQGWTYLGHSGGGTAGSDRRVHVWYKRLASASDADLEITWGSGGASPGVAKAFVYEGVHTTGTPMAELADGSPTGSGTLTLAGGTSTRNFSKILTLVAFNLDTNDDTLVIGDFSAAGLTSLALIEDVSTANGGGAALALFEGDLDTAGATGNATLVDPGGDDISYMMIELYSEAAA